MVDRDLAGVDEILSHLKWGQLVFNPPSEMRFKESKTIEADLLPSTYGTDLQEALRRLGGESQKIQYGGEMQAVLESDTLKITDLTPDKQPASKIKPTIWKWSVRSVEPDEQYITLTVNVLLRVNGSDRWRVIQVLSKKIAVNEPLGQRISGFVSDNWKWLWTAVVIPILGYLWNRKRKAQPGPDSKKAIGGDDEETSGSEVHNDDVRTD